MTLRNLRPGVLIGALLLAGCGVQDPYRAVMIEGGFARPCADETAPATPLFLPCPLAVDLAVNQIGILPDTAEAVEFHRGEVCADKPGCRLLADRGAVVVWLDGVPPIFLRVTPDFVGGFVAQPPELPPQWVVDRGPVAPRAP